MKHKNLSKQNAICRQITRQTTFAIQRNSKYLQIKNILWPAVKWYRTSISSQTDLNNRINFSTGLHLIPPPLWIKRRIDGTHIERPGVRFIALQRFELTSMYCMLLRQVGVSNHNDGHCHTSTKHTLYVYDDDDIIIYTIQIQQKRKRWNQYSDSCWNVAWRIVFPHRRTLYIKNSHNHNGTTSTTTTQHNTVELRYEWWFFLDV